MDINTAWQFGAALGLGMLIGLERERTRGTEKTFTGVRTFSLVALLGAASVYVGEQAGHPWIVGLVFLAIMALKLLLVDRDSREKWFHSSIVRITNRRRGRQDGSRSHTLLRC